MERFYYKAKDGTGFLSLKSQLNDENYIQITEEEFNKLTMPKEHTITAAAQEKARKIAEYKKYLADTDYIVLKIAERLADGDTTAVEQLKQTYSEQLKERKRVRSLLN